MKYTLNKMKSRAYRFPQPVFHITFASDNKNKDSLAS